MSSYKIPFVSITGNSYEIRIYPTAEGYDATSATQLVGAAEPIVTEEDNSTDIMTPVRSSTGYIRIVTDDYTLQSKLMPINTDEMRVTLLRFPKPDETDQTIRTEWEGYIMPNTYTQDWCAGPWEIELPIVSHLGMMMDAYLSDGNTGLLTVGAWLARLCGNVYKRVLIPNDELLKSSTMPWGNNTLTTPTVLQLAFSEELFKSPIALADREDPQNTTSGLWEPQTNRDIATSLCPIFRWIIREAGDSLICDDPVTSATTYKAYSPTQLLTDNPQPTSTEQESMVILTAEQLGEQWQDAVIGDKDGTKEVLLPFSRVSIESTTGEYAETIINPSDQAWQKAAGIPLVNGAPESHNRPDSPPGSSTTIKTQKIIDNAELESFQYFARDFSLEGANVAAGSRVQSLIGNERTSMAYVNNFPNVALGSYGANLSTSGVDIVGGGEISAEHQYYSKNDAYVHTRRNSVLLGKIYTDDTTLRPAIRLRCSLAHLLPYSSMTKRYVSLLIQGKATYGQTYANPEANKEFGTNIYAVKASVKIGNYYLSKNTWGDHTCSLSTGEAPFDILWAEEEKGEIKEYLRIPIPEGFPMTLDAPIEVTLYTPSDAPRASGQNVDNNYKYLRIDNFEVSICRQQDDDKSDTSEPIVADIDTTISMTERLHNNKLEEYELRTAIGGPDNPGALIANIPVTIDGVSTSKFPARKVGSLDGDNDGARYLCRRTFDFLKTQAKHIRHCVTIPLRTSRPWAWPTISRINLETETYFPAAVKRSWRDDNITATLIELKYE